MTREQKLNKMMIKADLRIVEINWNLDNKADRLQAAYHMQQAIEKTIKLKADILGLEELWGHNIAKLIKDCEEKNIDIFVPKLIQEKADMYTEWETDGRYFPTTVVRRDAIKKAYDVTVEWLESGATADKQRKTKGKTS